MVASMNSTNYIFGKPDFVEGIGRVYPVMLENYDEFLNYSHYLYISKNHFTEDVQSHPLLELLLLAFQDQNVINDLVKLFSFVLLKDVVFFTTNDGQFGFETSTGETIDSANYDILRQTIMRQNLMFEQKVYKDKIVQAYMHKVFEAKAKNSIKMEFEDKISTVSVFTGKHYWDLEKYTIYQLEVEFSRISKMKNYDTTIAARVAGSDAKIEHFAENVDLFKNPYDLSNFTKSKDSVKKLDTSTK